MPINPGMKKLVHLSPKNRMLSLLLALVFWTGSAIPAAGAQPAATVKQPGTQEPGYCAQATSDGGYIIASYCFNTRGDRDLYLLKTNAQGKKEWEKTCGGDKDDQANWVQETKDGSFIVCGYTMSKSGKGKDMYLLHVDKRGQISWEKNYGGRLQEEKTPDNKDKKEYEQGFEVFDYNSSAGLSKDYYDVFLFREEKGSDNADKNSEYTEDEANCVQVTSDGGYVLAGYSRPNGKTADLCLVKVDFRGVLQWARSIGGGHEEAAASIQQTKDGGYIVAGYTRSVGLGSRSRSSNSDQKNREDKDAYLIKTDYSGYLQWEKTFGGVKEDEACSVETCADGSYLICGYSSQPSGQGSNLLLIKTSSSGELIWQVDNWAGQGSACATGVKQIKDGSYLLTGNTTNSQANKSTVFLIHASEKGDFLWDREWKKAGESSAGQVQIMPDGSYMIAARALMINNEKKELQLNPVMLNYDDTGRLKQELMIVDHLLNRPAGEDIHAGSSPTSTDSVPPIPQAKGARRK